MTDRLNLKIRRLHVTGHGPLPAARLREALERALEARLMRTWTGDQHAAHRGIDTDATADHLAARAVPHIESAR